MNSTKLLCKLFDDDNKGYVTIGDILLSVFVWLILCLIVYSMGAFAYGIATDNLVSDGWVSFIQFAGSLLWSCAFLGVVIWAIFEGIPALMKIRITTCELKKK
ncbi:MAG: hypothetical protein KAJ03_00465, partial [Gammaproteobacteria bacterium]|nr:hypothetical protein [Gammaproteobacteria bacterium]